MSECLAVHPSDDSQNETRMDNDSQKPLPYYRRRRMKQHYKYSSSTTGFSKCFSEYHSTSKMSIPEPIFCCASAVSVNTSNTSKLYNDPNRQIHNAIYQSFLAFAYRSERAVSLMALIMGDESEPENELPLKRMPVPQALMPLPVLTVEALQNNPITPDTPYVIHLTSRHDYGPVYSHRYFVCPPNLQLDWIEVSLEQWFAVGEQFKLKAEKWDIKCLGDSKVCAS